MVQVGGIRVGPGPGRRARGRQGAGHASRSTTASSSARRARPPSRCSTCSARSTSTWSPAGDGPARRGHPDPGRADLVGLRHRRRLRRPDRRPPSRSTPTSSTQALDVVADTVNQSAPEIQASFEGIARLSETVASRDAEIQALLAELARRQRAARRPQPGPRRPDAEQRPGLPGGRERRKEAIHRLLVNARILARQLRGVATGQPGPDRPRPCARSTSCWTC